MTCGWPWLFFVRSLGSNRGQELVFGRRKARQSAPQDSEEAANADEGHVTVHDALPELLSELLRCVIPFDSWFDSWGFGCWDIRLVRLAAAPLGHLPVL